jgi:precorrin-3B C17-methyltransferase
MTEQVKNALQASDVVVGYDLYVKLIADMIHGKKVVSTPMKKEVDRCKIALEYAAAGNTVAMVCSGDAGVYGMAGIMLEVAAENPAVEIEVVAGITAACSSAAVLGAAFSQFFPMGSINR